MEFRHHRGKGWGRGGGDRKNKQKQNTKTETSLPGSMLQSFMSPLCTYKQVHYCFTSTEIIKLNYYGLGAQEGHLDFHTAPGLWTYKHNATRY